MTNEQTIQIENRAKKLLESVGDIHKNREKMADGKRYIIYYTFGGGTDKQHQLMSQTNEKTAAESLAEATEE